MDKKVIKISFDTVNSCWLVIIEGEQYQADHILLGVACFTTVDVQPDGRLQHFISAYYTNVEWIERMLIVK